MQFGYVLCDPKRSKILVLKKDGDVEYTLDFMPLVSANYSGGIVVTDWYSENNTPNESVKISVRFLTNEIRSDALDINVFLKKCSENLTNCSISKNNNDLVAGAARCGMVGLQ